MSTKKPISVCARRWFDGQNTYHSVRVVFDDGSDAIEPFEYGYGDAWTVTAANMCASDASTAYRYLRDLRESGHVFALDCVDVSRRGDLHENGRRAKAQKEGGAR